MYIYTRFAFALILELTKALLTQIVLVKKIKLSHYLGYDHYGGDVSYDKGSKEMGLKDLFDIALTTLAFLSFGMFILQVLMCITMVNQEAYDQPVN